MFNKHKFVQLKQLVCLYVLFSNKDKQRDDSLGNSSFKMSCSACAYGRINYEKKKKRKKKIPLRVSKLSTTLKIAKNRHTWQKAKFLLLEGRTPFGKLTLLCSANKGLCKVSKANQFCWKDYIPEHQLTEVHFLVKRKKLD